MSQPPRPPTPDPRPGSIWRGSYGAPVVAVMALLVILTTTACVEQSRERKKFGRTFESTRTGAYMPFNFAPVPEGRWVDPSTQWKMNTSGALGGTKATRQSLSNKPPAP